MLLLAFQSVFVLSVCYAVVSDFRNLIIPNWVVVTLVAAFAIFAAIYMDAQAILMHVALAAFVFALFTAFFVAGWIAGGDVKFITAVALWMGVEQGAPFVLLTAVLGSLLALALLQVKTHGPFVGEGLGRTWLFRRVSSMAEASQCPYGVAIGIAALLASGGIFHPA